MANNSRNTRSDQRRGNRYKDIEDAQQEWHKNTERLLENKNKLGYENFPWDAFLEVDPETISGEAQKQLVIELQEHYKTHSASRARLWAETDVVEEMNKKHAILHINQTHVLTEKLTARGNRDFGLESKPSFIALYENQRIQSFDGVWRSKAEIWLKSPQRRTYLDITFDPTTTEHVGGYYNIWRGFKFSPKKGDCSLFWEHVWSNICSKNEELYNYVRKWVAYVVQRPQEVHTALVLCGSQGVGKNRFVDPIGKLFGQHYTVLSSMHELVSNFNFHMKDAVLIHANEALWGGHKKDLGTVKAMITDDTYLIEGKGKDRIMMPNFRHVIISSNEAWPVHIDADCRRFVVIQVSDARKEDHTYFKAIQNQLSQFNNSGYEALLHDLLHEDLSDFDPRILPKSNNAFDIKMLSATSVERYIYEALIEGAFQLARGDDDDDHKKSVPKAPKETPVWQGPIPKESVYKDYAAWCEENGEGKPVSDAIFGRTLKKIIPSLEGTRRKPQEGASRAYCYVFPSLDESREAFCKSFKVRPEDLFGPRNVEESSVGTERIDEV